MQDAGQDRRLTVLQLNDLIDHLLSDDGFLYSRQIYRAALRRDLDLQLQCDLTIVVNGWRHIDIDADIEIGKLRLYADVSNPA